MEFLFAILGWLISAAIIGGIGFGIYKLIQRGRRNGGDTLETEDTGVGTPRRFYFYSISFIATLVAAIGVMITLMSLLDTLFGGDVLLDSPTELATGLAMTIVGIPLWALHWRWVQNAVASNDQERRSILRHLHLHVTSGVALAFIGISGYLCIEFILGAAEEFDAFSWAALPIWGVVWYYHRLIAASDEPFETPETRAIRRLYLYLASAVAVSALASGAGWLLYIILREGYSAAFAVSVVTGEGSGLWRDSTAQAIAVSVTGGLSWASHWLRLSRDDRDSVLRWIYLYLASVGFGAIAAFTALGIIVATVIRWPFGVTDVSDHFEDLPGAVAAVAAAVAVWAYHRHRMKAEASEGDPTPIARIYDCLLTAIGLVTLASASITVFTLIITELSLIGSVVIGDMLEGDLWDNVSVALTLLLIGAPVWWIHWTRLQSAATADPEAERPALPRKLYVMGVLCIGVLALVGGASFTLFVFLRDLLDVALSLETLRELSVGLAILLTVALFVPYHWNIYREDRRYEPDDVPEPPPIVRKRVTLLTAPGGEDAARRIEAALGYRITVAAWRDSDATAPALDEAQAASIVDRVSAAPGENVILVPELDGLRIVSHG